MQTNNQYYKLICENMGIPIEEGIHTNNYYLRRIAQSYGISYTEKTICNGMILKDIAEAITENTYTGHHFNNFYLKDIAESLTGNDYNTEFDNYYLEVWAENTIAKNTTNLSWDIEITDFVYSDEFNASGILTSNGNPISNAPVNLMIGNTVMATATTNANGIVSFTNAPVHVGTHRFYLKFNGNANYIESSSTIVEINVSKETSQMVITNEDNDNYYTDAPIAIVGSLVDNDTPTHQPISTKTITVTDGIHNYTGETESDGSFLIPISNLPIGTYTFDIEFSDEDYTTSSKQLVMNIVDPYLSVSATKDILSYEDGDSSVLTATLHSGSAVGKSIKIYKDDVLLETKQTDSSGQVSVTYESAGVGDVVFKFEYGILVSEIFSVEDCLLYQDMATILSDWSKDTSVSGRTIYKLTPNYQSDVELTFKIANNVPSNFLCGFGETGTGSPIYWGKAMFHRENGTLWYFVDNSDIRLGSSVSTDTVFKLTTENLHKVNAYLDDTLQAYRNTNTSRGLNLRIDSYTATPLTLEYLKVKPITT